MIHDLYRALATRREALKWFTVKAAKAANVILLPAATRNSNSHFGSVTPAPGALTWRPALVHNENCCTRKDAH